MRLLPLRWVVEALVLMLPASAMAGTAAFSVGESVPVFTLKALNPEQAGDAYVSIDKFYGTEAVTPKKAVILSFFATYCEPCKKEMPYLAALDGAYREAGLQILLVSIDKEKEKMDEALILAQEAGVKFPLLSDRFNIVAKRYAIEKLPNLYVLDAAGQVTLGKVGYTDEVTRELLEEVRRNLGLPQSNAVPSTLAPYIEGAEVMDTPAVAANESAVAKPGNDAPVAAVASDDKTKVKKAKRKKKRRKKRRRRK